MTLVASYDFCHVTSHNHFTTVGPPHGQPGQRGQLLVSHESRGADDSLQDRGDHAAGDTEQPGDSSAEKADIYGKPVVV